MALNEVEFAKEIHARFRGAHTHNSPFRVWLIVAKELFRHLDAYLDLSDLISEITVTGSSASVDPGDQVILVNNTAPSSAVLTLPLATASAGAHLWVKDIAGTAATHSIVLDPGSALVDGASGTHVAVDTAYGAAHYYCDGTGWYLLSSVGTTSSSTGTTGDQLVAPFSRAAPNGLGFYLGAPPTSAAPLVVPETGTISMLSLSVDRADPLAWSMQVRDATTKSVLATLNLPIGQRSERLVGLSVPVTAGDLLEIRLVSTNASTFRRGVGSIHISYP